MYRPTSAVTAMRDPIRRHEAHRVKSKREGVGGHRVGAERGHHPDAEQRPGQHVRRRAAPRPAHRPNSSVRNSRHRNRQSRRKYVTPHDRSHGEKNSTTSRRDAERSAPMALPRMPIGGKPELAVDEHPCRQRRSPTHPQSVATSTAIGRSIASRNCANATCTSFNPAPAIMIRR